MAQMNETHRSAVAGMGEGQDEGAQYRGAKISQGKEILGKVVQISGPAVDVQFDEKTMPSIYEALRVVSEGFDVPSPINVILEVQQHIGEGRVRCVAMESTEGMVRFAARHEYARTVEDVLARRSRMLFLDARLAASVAPVAGTILKEETGADPRIAEFEQLAGQYLDLPTAT